MDVSSILKIYFTYQSSNDPIESLCKREANLVRGKMQTDTLAQLLKLQASKWCMEMHCIVQPDS